MPLDKSWTPSIILFVLAGITLVVIVGVIIYWLKTKDRTEHESKKVVENKAFGARIPRPSRKQNCDKLAGMYLDYYDKFKNLLDEIAKSNLEDYKKFLKDNEMLVEYKGSSKNSLEETISNTLTEQGFPQLKHPMLENKKTDEMKSVVAEMLKLASVIHPNLHGELSRSLARLDMDGFYILVDGFKIKYPDSVSQTDTWFANVGTLHYSKRLMTTESWLRDEPTTMLKIINRYKSWWRWLYE